MRSEILRIQKHVYAADIALAEKMSPVSRSSTGAFTAIFMNICVEALIRGS